MMLGTFGILSTEMGMIGILPQVAEFFNVNISQAGLFVSLFALIIAISGAFMPLVCSKFDRKKMFVLVLSVFTIFTFLSALITDFYLALIVRAVPAFFHPIYCSLAFTAAAEIVPESEAQSAISKVMMGVSAGMIVGVPITSYLASSIGYQISMLWFTLVCAIALIATVIFFPELPGKDESYGSQLSVAKTGLFLISVIAIIVFNAGLFGAYSYISDFLQSVTLIVGAELSIVLFIYGFASILGNWIGGKLISKNANRTVLSFPFIISMVFLGLFFMGALEIPTIILVAFWGLLSGIGNVILQYWIVSAAPSTPEFANGMFLSMSNIGVTVGTTIGGFIILSYGTSYIMLTAIIIQLLAFCLFLIRTKKYPTV